MVEILLHLPWPPTRYDPVNIWLPVLLWLTFSQYVRRFSHQILSASLVSLSASCTHIFVMQTRECTYRDVSCSYCISCCLSCLLAKSGSSDIDTTRARQIEISSNGPECSCLRRWFLALILFFFILSNFRLVVGANDLDPDAIACSGHWKVYWDFGLRELLAGHYYCEIFGRDTVCVSQNGTADFIWVCIVDYYSDFYIFVLAEVFFSRN